MVSGGGIFIIASILGILIFILAEVMPLMFPAKVDVSRKVAVPGAGRIGVLLSDEYRTHVSTLDETGKVRVVRLSDGKEVYAADFFALPALEAGHPPLPARERGKGSRGSYSASVPLCRRRPRPSPWPRATVACS